VDKIPVVIIRTPDSERILPLLAQLSHCENIDVVILDATMGRDLNEPSLPSRSFEMNAYGRNLTQNERACAISHSRARQLIAETGNGGAILEDDARILDCEKFQHAMLSFLESQQRKASVLSLLAYSTGESGHAERSVKSGTRKLFTESPLAVAAVLTPNAATELARSGMNESQTADWPSSPCKFYILESGVVSHGDEQTQSVIGGTIDRINRNTNPFKSSTSLRWFKRRFLQKLDSYRIKRIQS
jgi:hypothetical protein